MGCFDEGMSNIMEPYGGNFSPFSSDKTDATVTIVQESYDDGMKVTRIQTPPRTETSKLMEAINSVLGFFGQSCPSLDKDGQKPSESSDKSSEGDDSDDKKADVQSKFKSKKDKNQDNKSDGSDKPGRFGQADDSDRDEDED